MGVKSNVVSPRKGNDDKTYFTKVGVVFENASGKGMTLILEAYPLPDEKGQVRVLLMEPNDRDDRDDRDDRGRGRDREERRPPPRRREPEVTSGRQSRRPIDDDLDSGEIPF